MALIFLAVTMVVSANYGIIRYSRTYIYTTTADIPVNDVGLLLGTSRYVARGVENQYFRARVNAAALLYLQGRIKHIIVSGDNRTRNYDEATEMQKALIELGVPDSCITKDYAGLRTFDSVIRCRDVFGISRVTIISQRFHIERAIYIARHKNIDAIGFAAQDVEPGYGRKTMIREVFAKFKAILDIHILNTQPRHLGKKEEIKL